MPIMNTIKPEVTEHIITNNRNCIEPQKSLIIIGNFHLNQWNDAKSNRTLKCVL